uniref:Uncharacterized protein n=1 Tax=Fagus sylvatica TaxID=28930 RepID=A0A2N9EHW2_FAGSY
MRRHAPRLSPVNPPVLISASVSRLLRLSFERHPRLRLVKTNLHQKYRSQKTLHAPPRAGEASGLFFAQIHAPRPDPRPDPPRDPHVLYFLMDKNAQGVFRCFLSPISKQLQLWLPCHLSSPRSQNKINCGCHATPCPLLYQDISL